MFRTTRLVGLVLVLGFALAACSGPAYPSPSPSPATPPVTPTPAPTAMASASVGPSASVALASGATHSAHGSVQNHITGGALRIFTFSARGTNGGATGSAQVVLAGMVVVQMNIDCLRVEGNTAVMSGTYTQAFDGGEAFVVAVTDNGVGTNARPDVITPVLDDADIGQVPTCLNADITALFGFRTFVVEMGNLIVN